ncbi:MAG: PilZ domain-containing protein [Granulosicoccus sp.]|nr:PilZ domain-containing protein [Granulosicoccus sp.]
MAAQLNRRDSFRLEDVLDLRVRLLDEQALQIAIENFDSFRMRHCLKSHAQSQKDINQPRMTQIRNRQPEIAQYLEYLESRILDLSEQIEKLHSEKAIENYIALNAQGDLSANGIKFHTSTAFAENQMLEIWLTLSSSGTQVFMLGEVVRVDGESDADEKEAAQYVVSVRYTKLHSEDKEAIVRHLVKLQQTRLQAARQA